MTSERAPLSPGGVGRSWAVLVVGVGGAQAVGIVRELFLASQVGLSGDLDAMLIAIGLTSLAAGIITGGAAGALVPIYIEARTAHGREDARRLAGTVISWIGLAGLGISLGIALIAPLLITLTGPGLAAADHDRATDYLRMLTPVMFITVITTMMRVICQAEERFGLIALSTLAGPAATVATMLILWGTLHLGALAVGSVVGAAVTLGVLLAAAARASAVPIPRLTLDPRLSAWARHAGPLTVSGGILEIRGIADRAVASLLGPGSVSALRYATVLIQPLTQIGPAWASVIYPRLVQSTLGAPGGSLATWADRMLRYAIVIFTPIAALTAAVAPLAVFVAYGRGAFTASDMSLTAGVLAAYAPIIVTLMMLPVLVGSHNARRRGRLMLMGGTVNVILNVVLDLALGFWLGAPGIALGTSIAEIVVVAIFVRALAHSADAFDLGPLVRTIALAFVAVAPAGIAVAVLAWSGFGARDTITGALVLAGFGVVGVLGYVAVASWLDLAPAREVIKYVRERLRGILPSVRRSGRRSD